MNVSSNTFNASLIKLLTIVSSAEEIVVRGSATKEVTSILVDVNDPVKRCYYLPHRRDNIAAKCAEFLWMFSGRDDIGWLSFYLPRAPQWSDDGNVWRGAYGPRLRNHYSVDQIRYVVELLNKDPNSRQAIINIWSPTIDTNPGKDIPCNIALQFLIRNGKLDVNIMQRSCDVIWGYSGVDTFNWSVLQEMIAFWTHTKVGLFHHFIGSLHLYDRHYEVANDILGNVSVMDAYHKLGLFNPLFYTDFTLIDKLLSYMMFEEGNYREYVSIGAHISTGYIENTLSFVAERDHLLRDFLASMFVYIELKHIKDLDNDGKSNECDYTNIAHILNLLDDGSDIKFSTVEYVARYNPTILDAISINDKEYEFIVSYLHTDLT